MKTGTTFLQNLLIENKDALASAGYLFPGHTWVRQIRAAQDLLGATHGDPVIQSEARGAWEAIAQQMLEHKGTASVLSMEFLSYARSRQARRAVTSLASAEVHVILTARDTTATIPSQWQTTVRSGKTINWPDFMQGTRKAAGFRARRGPLSDPAALKFQRSQDIARMLEVWGRYLPPERLHVVTVPTEPANPKLLWERFAAVIGLDPDLSSNASHANESLGYTSTELLRRVNLELGPVPPTDYNATVRKHLARGVLATRSGNEVRPLLDRETCAFGLAWNGRTRQGVIDSGALLAGDLRDLPTTMTAAQERVTDDEQPPPTQADLLEVAEVAADAMRMLVDSRARRARKRGVDLEEVRRDRPSKARGSGAGGDDPVSSSAAEIADLCRHAIELRRRIRA